MITVMEMVFFKIVFMLFYLLFQRQPVWLLFSMIGTRRLQKMIA
ncbi:hypothetical protein RUMOBE_01202 [Blautia obeum ATCC 29174]|uniref:Uncharacterized protein n=1 Tax=Blautia obeum ATCC 29174 TaxID=411459 RepID=A5ZQD1_9FIRM|nr:hypothetical protein RUMOBE_01202 [Blautia obeum ATCC 29174]